MLRAITMVLMLLLLSDVCKLDSLKADLQQGVIINKVQMKFAPETSAEVGSRITLTCSVNIVGASSLTSQILYLFYKGSDSDVLLNSTVSSQQRSQVTIESARASHTGYYSCVVKVGNEAAKSEVLYLDVAGKLQTPRITIHPLKVIMGNQIELRCEAVEEIPPLEFIFYKYKNGQPSPVGDETVTSRNSVTHTLKVTEATDQAYSCKIQGRSLETSSNCSEIVGITVQDPFSSHAFTIEPKNGIHEGDNLTITCTVRMSSLMTSQMKPQLMILKGVTPMKRNESLEIKYSKVASSKDTGSYSCIAMWNQTSKSIQKQVIVAVPVSKPSLNSTAFNSIVTQGDRLHLTCAVVTGSWPIIYTFYKGTPENSLHRSILNATAGVYTIPSADTADSGEYFCKAENKAGVKHRSERSQNININVKVPVSEPKVNLLTSRTTYEIGKRISIRCHSTNGSSPVTYSLFLNQRFIHSVKNCTTEPVVFNILINNTKDGGVYKCKAENEILNSSKYSEGINFTVMVPVSTPLLFPLLNSTKAHLGENVTLHCTASTGTLPITYTLYRNHSRLTAISATKPGSAVFHVTIKTTEHSGYTCKAENLISSQCSNTIEFFILIPVSTPLLFPLLNSTKAHLGENVTLHCTASTGTLPITYTLYRNHSRLTAISATKPGSAVFHVTIKTTEHSGYTCKAENLISSQCSNTIVFFILSTKSMWLAYYLLPTILFVPT
ncbi:Fc receptor-like protein 5 [Amblyraja radiata]|uniref:Fc receptor-like protein 5 n=1 Tax=Amblyraja radiata TaxID=386614 RepID=UPI001401C181|nr:Fc receptor-like protein 5 [Amblyraja radiata]